MTTPGQLVILNGPPRSGKSSIAAAIQNSLEGVWMNLGVDRFMAMTPIAGIEEVKERRGAIGVTRDHVQDPHLRAIGQQVGDLLRATSAWVRDGDLAYRSFALARRRVGLARIAGQVKPTALSEWISNPVVMPFCPRATSRPTSTLPRRLGS
jgi:Chloramphenicol phosphotransferase-like protein